MRGRMPLSRRLLVSVLATIIAFPVGSWPPTIEGTSGGSPYNIPGVVDTNGDPNIVETTITADETLGVNIGGGVT